MIPETAFDNARDDLLTWALELLPPLPCAVDVLSEDGGAFALTLADREAQLLYGYGDRNFVRRDVTLEARLREAGGDGFDIEFHVINTYFQSGDELLVHLHVIDVNPHTASRGAIRAQVAELAEARVVYARGYERDEQFGIRLADVSTSGVAFITDKTFHPGDLLVIHSGLDNRSLEFDARVVRSDPAIYGRNRVGCEITRVLDADRYAIAALAEAMAPSAEDVQRHPEITEALERKRAGETLLSRRAQRYPYSRD